MSRSKKKVPINSHTHARSEKQDKRIANRTFRREEKRMLDQWDEHTEFHDKVSEVYDVWSMSKDGKHWPRKREWMTIEYWQELIAKLLKK